MISLLESDFGIAGDALKWITAFLRGRCQRVRVQQVSSLRQLPWAKPFSALHVSTLQNRPEASSNCS